MNKDLQQIKDTLNRLDKIQISHIESFDMELMPDLELQLVERKKEFDKLNTVVSRFVKNGGLDNDTETQSMVYFFIECINTLLNQNKMLEKKVRAHRDYLQESMKRLSRGKLVIGSYGSPSSISNRPRAINLTN